MISYTYICPGLHTGGNNKFEDETTFILRTSRKTEILNKNKIINADSNSIICRIKINKSILVKWKGRSL